MGINSTYNSRNRGLKRYLKEIANLDFLTIEEERTIFEAIMNGDMVSQENLIHSNLKFVVAVANRYRCSKIPLCDLINDGNIGLIKSIKKFDPTKGVRFLTFAYPYIKGAILASIYDNYSLIRIPRNQWLIKVTDSQSDENDAEPKISSKEITDELQNTSKNVTYKSIFFTDDLNSFHELFIDEPNFLEEIEAHDGEEKVNKIIRKIIARLSDKEQYIIRATFGLNGQKETTYEVLGDKFGVSRERIRIIRKKALEKLRRMIAHLEAEDLLDV